WRLVERRRARARVELEIAIERGLRTRMLVRAGGPAALEAAAERIRTRASDAFSEAASLLASGRAAALLRRKHACDGDLGAFERRHCDPGTWVMARLIEVHAFARVSVRLDHHIDEVDDPVLGHTRSCVEGAFRDAIVSERRLGDLDDEQCAPRMLVEVRTGL